MSLDIATGLRRIATVIHVIGVLAVVSWAIPAAHEFWETAYTWDRKFLYEGMIAFAWYFAAFGLSWIIRGFAGAPERNIR